MGTTTTRPRSVVTIVRRYLLLADDVTVTRARRCRRSLRERDDATRGRQHLLLPSSSPLTTTGSFAFDGVREACFLTKKREKKAKKLGQKG